MKRLKNAGRRLLAVLAAVGLLTGCGVSGYARSQPPAATVPPYSALPDVGDGWKLPQNDGTAGSQASVYGSVGLLAFPSVLVSVYLDEADGGHVWSEEGIQKSRENLALAISWIEEQAARYNAAPKIAYDDGTSDELCLRVDYDGHFSGGEDADEGDEFYDAADEFCASVDTDALHEQYGTASVGFLLFLPVEGSSFTMVYDVDYNGSWYYEYSCLYEYDAYSAPGTFDSPAVYAHEILHLYGAPDLYEGSVDSFVTSALSAHVEQNWPDAIMLGVYEENEEIRYDVIEKSLCPVTAYRLGLCDTFAGIEAFPEVQAQRPGVFQDAAGAVQEPPQGENDGLAA